MATETKLRQLAQGGCPVYYFYSSERYLVRQAVARAAKLLAEGEDEETTVLDFWWETHGTVDGEGKAKTRHTVFITEPQLWYNVGQHFGCENLSLGGEVEITNNFGSTDGAKVRPCLGVKWDF